MSTSPIHPPFNTRSQKHNCADFGPQAFFRRNNPDGTIEYLAAPCDRWPCRRCAPRLRVALINEIHRVSAQNGLTQLLTLTLRRDTEPRPGHYSRKLLRKWGDLRTLYAKHYNISLPFVWFKQIEKGWPHLHIFTCGLARSWVEKQWKKRTGAYEYDLQAIDPASVLDRAGYTTRQIRENATAYGRSCGHWWGTSRGISLVLRRRGRGEQGWERYNGPLDMQAMGYNEDDYDVLRRDPTGVHLMHVRVKAKGDPHADA